MLKPVSMIAIAMLALPAVAFPAFGQDGTPPRTPWQKAEPAPGKTVRWIVEGCAAYPVAVDAELETPVPDEGPRAKTGMTAAVAHPTARY